MLIINLKALQSPCPENKTKPQTGNFFLLFIPWPTDEHIYIT